MKAVNILVVIFLFVSGSAIAAESNLSCDDKGVAVKGSSQFSFYEGQEYQYKIDVNVPDKLAYDIEILNLPAEVIFDSATRTLIWKPSFQVVDGPGFKTFSATVAVYVQGNPVNYYEREIELKVYHAIPVIVANMPNKIIVEVGSNIDYVVNFTSDVSLDGIKFTNIWDPGHSTISTKDLEKFGSQCEWMANKLSEKNYELKCTILASDSSLSLKRDQYMFLQILFNLDGQLILSNSTKVIFQPKPAQPPLKP